MAGMSISGLASGLDTTTLVSQLMQLERQPQDLLKTKLSDAKADASAYRTVNSSLATLRSAAEALTKAAAWTPAKASSTSATVSASASAGATTGSVTFTVEKLAETHAFIGSADWVAPSSATTLTVTDKNGNGPGFSVEIAAGSSLADAVKEINDAATTAKAGVVASTVATGSGTRLQLTAKASGTDGVFEVTGGPSTFEVLATGSDARLKVGSGTFTLPVVSPTNTFSDVLAGTTFTVGKAGETATVTVAADPGAVTTAVQSLVTAANNALSVLSEYGNNSPGSKAVLRGDSALRDLAGQVLDAVSLAVGDDVTGSAVRSPAAAGLQLTRDGRITFDAATFTARLKADPAVARRLVDGEGGVPGVAQRLMTVTSRATDSTTGSLVTLANGRDRQVTDLQQRIDAWDLRLEQRQETLTKQFTALERALGGLKNQSSWLSSQLANLPSWSRS